MAYIEFTAGSYAGERRDLTSESITIGRNPEAHILLDDIASSSNHAELRFHEGHWWLLDLGSANGTELNSAPVESAALQPGDVVTVGLTSFIFQNEIADEPTAQESAQEAAQEAAPTPAAPAETAVSTNENELALVEKMQILTERIRTEVGKVIVGQKDVLDQIMMCILANGHALLIGLPGMAKTLTVKTISDVLNLNFKRVQFTPDLMPGDIIGTDVLETNKSTGEKEFRFIKGPIFCNLLLADEINRTPPKTQAALLEAMQEKMVTAGNTSYKLPDPFFVLATQNPIEQEGTYPLPEAQLDRFMFNIWVDYPLPEEEEEILRATTSGVRVQPQPVLTRDDVLQLQAVVRKVPVSDHVIKYVTKLVGATRPGNPNAPELTKTYVSTGAGPRAGQFLILAAKATAILEGRLHVSCADIRRAAPPVLRHRIMTNFAADSEGLSTLDIVKKLLVEVKEPGAEAYPAAKQTTGKTGIKLNQKK
jgi:MoxR-like ATPase